MVGELHFGAFVNYKKIDAGFRWGTFYGDSRCKNDGLVIAAERGVFLLGKQKRQSKQDKKDDTAPEAGFSDRKSVV